MRHGRCASWTESRKRVVRCVRPAELDHDDHVGVNHLGQDVYWIEVRVAAPADQ